MDYNTGKEPKRVLVPEVERSPSKLDVVPIPSVLEEEGNATSILKVTAVAHKRKISAAPSKSEESFAPQKVIQNATVIKWVGSAAASKSEESFVVPEAKESAAASKSEESFVVPEAKESAAASKSEESFVVPETKESAAASKSEESFVVPEAKESAAASKSEESFVVPEAKESAAASKSEESFVVPEAKESAAASKSEESFVVPEAKESAAASKSEESFVVPEAKESAAASKSEESFVVPEAKESAAASKSEESFVVPEAKESAAVFRWTGSVAVYEWRESDIPFWLTKTPPVSESKGSGVATTSRESFAVPKAKGSDVVPKAKGSDVVPQAKGSDVVPQAKGSDVVPQAKGSDVVPQAKGSDVAPKAKGGVPAHTLKGVVPMPSMAESPSNTFNMKDFLGESWTDYDLVMEIGCGDGRATKTFIIQIIKKFWAYYAVDINPKLIKIANERYSHPKLEYRVADIESISTFKPVYLHRFTKIISLNCIHCMKTSQRPAFENIHHLLTKNGVAHILFIVSHPFWSVYSKLFQMRKWRKHLKDSSFRVPCSHEFNLGAENYRILLEEIGFIVLYAEDRFIPIIFKDVSEFKNSYATFCSQYVCRVPHNLEEAFLQDSLKVFLKFAKRDSGGHWSSQFKILILRLLKPEISRA